MGNRLQQIINGVTTNYTYGADNRLLTNQSTATSFDGRGNLLTNGVLSNTWDAANRLVSSQSAGQLVSQTYDGLGNRVAQTVGATTTNYALDVALGLAEVIFTSEGQHYLHLPGVIMTSATSGTTRYLLSDGLGSIRQATDELGQVVATASYDPYGNPLGGQDSGYGYTGEPWLAELGLLHLRARWYDPSTATFLSRDALEMKPPYQYAKGNPINRVDPTGYIDWDLCMNTTGYGDYLACSADEGDTIVNIARQVYDAHQSMNGYGFSIFDLVKVFNVINSFDPSTPLQAHDIVYLPRSWVNLMQPHPSKPLNGYVEGTVTEYYALFCKVVVIGGEVVYDFKTNEIAQYTYVPLMSLPFLPPGAGLGGFSTSDPLGTSITEYAGLIFGFKSNEEGATLDGQYSGAAWSLGASVPWNTSFENHLIGTAGAAYGSSAAQLGNLPLFIPNHDLEMATFSVAAGFDVSGKFLNLPDKEVPLPVPGVNTSLVYATQVEGTHNPYSSRQQLLDFAANGTYAPTTGAIWPIRNALVPLVRRSVGANP